MIRFGVYELDPMGGELRKGGITVKLQPQPFKVLALLASRAAQIVSKEEIRHQLWGATTFVDIEKGVSFCLKQVRAALGDNAKNPRFVETLPRRGYRFIAPIDRLQSAEGRPSSPADAEIALAVLPFDNISANQEDAYFADGMTEALINELAHISAIRVISRTSVMQYKGAKRSLPEIARDLKVNAVVEGTVLRSGKRVRIAVQLIDARTDRNLWADSYERGLRHVLALQSDVARAISSEIKVKLTPAEQNRLTSGRMVNPEAYESYLKGRYYWNKRIEACLRKSIEYFEDAIRKDPTYPEAYAGLADAHATLGFYETRTSPPREDFAKAKAAALKALTLDSDLAEALTSLAVVEWAYDWDKVGADRHFRRAIALNPNYVTARHWHALCLISMRQLDEGIAQIRLARELDPLSLSVNTSVALCLCWARRFDQAIEQARMTLELDPNYPMAHLILGLAHEQKADWPGSIVELEKSVELSQGSLTLLALLGRAYALAGDRLKARKVFRQLRELSKTRYVSAYGLSMLHAGFGDYQQSIALLQKAFEERSGFLVYLDVDPRFDPLRHFAGFRDFRRHVGAEA